jgi:hypothetical protein
MTVCQDAQARCMTPEEVQRLLSDAESGRLQPVRYTKARRPPIVLAIAVLLAGGLVAGAAGAALHVLLAGGRFFDPQPWITGLVIGAGSCFALGVAQPWGERRRARNRT